MVLLAAIALGAGAARFWARRRAAAAPAVRSWTRTPGVPVELRGDGVYFVRAPATVRRLLATARHPCTPRVGPVPLRAGDRVAVRPRCRVAVDRMAGAARLTLGLALDLDRDDADDLAALPGVGARRARAIVADRERRGPFGSLEALARVRGIGRATIRGLRRAAIATGVPRAPDQPPRAPRRQGL